MKSALQYYMEARSDEELTELAAQYEQFVVDKVIGDCVFRDAIEGLFGSAMFHLNALAFALALYKVKAQRAEAMLRAQADFIAALG